MKWFNYKAAIMLILYLSISNTYGQDRSEEYGLKAVLLSRLLSFITWPESLPAGKQDFCVLGSNPFPSDLHDRLTDAGIELLLKDSDDQFLESCKLVFIAESELRDIESIIDLLRGKSILTISDIPRFAESGGMINLTFENRRVRFRINKQAADREDITISYQLLELSDLVQEDYSRESF